MPCAGLGLLTIAHWQLIGMSGRLVIAQRILRDVLLLPNMNKMFPTYDSVAVGHLGLQTDVPLRT